MSKPIIRACGLLLFALPTTAQVVDDAGERDAPLSGEAALSLPVAGLSDANADAVEGALRALKASVHACPTCDREGAEEKPCPRCRISLVVQERPRISSARADVAAGSVSVDVAAGRAVRLGLLEETLAAGGLTVDRQGLRIPGRAILILRGSADEEEARSLEKTLRSTGLFREAATARTKKQGELRMRVASDGQGPLYSAVVGALAGAWPSLELAEIVWEAPDSNALGKPSGREGVPRPKGKGKKGKKEDQKGDRKKKDGR
jgi:hypothetical protein